MRILETEWRTSKIPQLDETTENKQYWIEKAQKNAKRRLTAKKFGLLTKRRFWLSFLARGELAWLMKLKYKKYNPYLLSAVFIAQVLVGPNKQLKQIIQSRSNSNSRFAFIHGLPRPSRLGTGAANSSETYLSTTRQSSALLSAIRINFWRLRIKSNRSNFFFCIHEYLQYSNNNLYNKN